MFATHELQAVVLAAGPGSRMYPLTESGVSKALLPVGNRPLISYILNNLYQEGIRDALVVIRDNDVQLRNYLLESCDLNVTIATIKTTTDEYMGTAETLRTIKDKIKSDFMLISCDIVGQINLRDVLDMHRLRDSDVTCVFAKLPESELTGKRADGDVFYVGSDVNDGRLLYYSAAADVDDEITILKSLMHRYPRIRMHADYMDAHVYIFRRWVLDFICEKKSMVSMREEVVPLLVRRQLRQHKARSDNAADVYRFVPKDGHLMDKADSLRCYMFFQDSPCYRVNSLARYSDVNKAVLSLPMFDNVSRLAEDSVVGKTQISKDSLVGASCKIGDRCSVKKSVIGSHCTVAANVKLSNCVIMDHVRIEEGANLVNTIVCKNAYISANADLKDCQVAASYTVEPNVQAKGETLSNRGLL